ncbi:MAG: GNAT family N-acetyltransferase [Oleiphilaceae bacterium]|nr:GNAT family N-acetyltransferase [Oleiphilaceae bacterium]
MDYPSDPFRETLDGLGRFHLRPLQVPQDLPLIQGWLDAPRAHYWGMQSMTLAQLERHYRELNEGGKARAYLGFHEGQPAFLMECYDPAADPIGRHYQVEPGDCGMHILLAPPARPISGFSRGVFRFMMNFLFRIPGVQRVVVEPDSRNQAVHALNRHVGFVHADTLTLPEKTAHLSFCTRADFAAAMEAPLETPQPLSRLMASTPHMAATPFEPPHWEAVNRQLLCKALAEFAHERLIAPEQTGSGKGWGYYRVNTDDPAVTYHFRARLMQLDHWHIDPDSLQRERNGQPAAPDALALVTELAPSLGLAGDTLATYMEEISSTLAAAAWKHSRTGLDADTLVEADFQTLERAMSEGHPCFVANSGRIGFDAMDYQAYAPETGAAVQLVWLAVWREDSCFASSEGLDYERLMALSLDRDSRARFHTILREKGLDPARYYFMPVHPWQWFNRLASLFATDLGRQRLVCLGYAPERYQAQQSIRTFFNRDRPEAPYIKTALSVINMGFMRGLSPDYMSTTPAINDFLHDLIDQDPYLARTGFSLLREVAGMGYRQSHYEQALDKHSPQRKMLSALWRESPMPTLSPGQKPMTMAALLHRDPQGQALLPRLISASGLAPEEWLERYLHCYLTPLLHCFYAHDLVFMPHGENLILVMEGHVPVRALMKDIGEEAAIMNTDLVLGEKVQRLTVAVPEELKVLSLFTDLFDCFFRFMADILVQQGGWSEQGFWRSVADCVKAYQADQPQLAEKFRRYDLFAPSFTLSCLNRLQLANSRQMIDLADPSKNLQFAGHLKNPIAAFAPAPQAEAVIEDGDG